MMEITDDGSTGEQAVIGQNHAVRSLSAAQNIENTDYAYILKHGRYVLQREVRTADGSRLYIDSITNEITEQLQRTNG